MGINVFVADYLANFIVNRRISGSILTLGRQGVAMDVGDLIKILSKYGIIREENGEIHFPSQAYKDRFTEIFASKNAFWGHNHKKNTANISDYTLFGCLGFDIIESVDNSSFESASYIHDLNITGLSEKTEKQYDLIYDGGTSEHIFHQPNILNNIFNALKIDGYIIHNTPSNNHVDHGFYQFSPSLYFDWYFANKFNIVQKHFVKHTRNPDADPPIFYDLEPNTLENLSYGGLDGAMYATIFCAQKTNLSTCDVIPQQSTYSQAWRAHAGSQSDGA